MQKPVPNKSLSRSLYTAVILGAVFVAGAGWAGLAGADNSTIDQSVAAGVSDGSQIYMQARCFACHGEYGFGGAGPRFREDRFLGLTDYVVGQILVGRDIMPAFGDDLNDQQIAAVASYIRNSWGNKFGPIQSQQVAAIRNDVKLHPPQGQPHLPPSPADSGAPSPATGGEPDSAK